MDRTIFYLDYSRLIKQYIAPFHIEDPEAALKYAYSIALGGDAPAPTGDKQKQIALEVVRDIALASKDNRRKLLGSIARDGSVKVGSSLQLLETQLIFSLASSKPTFRYSSWQAIKTIYDK
jgi:hypothetical protein